MLFKFVQKNMTTNSSAQQARHGSGRVIRKEGLLVGDHLGAGLVEGVSRVFELPGDGVPVSP